MCLWGVLVTPRILKALLIFLNICSFLQARSIPWRIVTRTSFQSMEVQQMLLHLLSTPTFTLMLTMMVLKRL
nr:insulin-degrading enzyme-like 1, peroxisomal isoform X2 [Ipomoea batatas]